MTGKALCYTCRNKQCSNCGYPTLHPRLYKEYVEDMKRKDLLRRAKSIERELAREGLKVERDKIKELREIDRAKKHLRANRLENDSINKQYDMFKLMLLKDIEKKGLRTMSKTQLDNSRCYFCNKKGCQVGIGYTDICSECWNKLEWKANVRRITLCPDEPDEIDYSIILEHNNKKVELPQIYFKNKLSDVEDELIEILREDGWKINETL